VIVAYDIRISALRKSFGAVTALDGVDLSIGQGEMLGLIGPDGAGKTTALRILCGLLIAGGGSVLVAGLDPGKATRQVRGFLGYMPQRFSLYPDLTVAENLRFFADLFQVPPQEREKRLEQLLRFSRLGPFTGRLSARLSGGMKQKLALSCTLIHTPRILLLDEPTTGVDPVSRQEFWEILGSLRQEGVTILVTTPYMDEAAKCDRVAFIHKGRILSVAAPAEIPRLYSSQLLEVQCRECVAAARALRDCGSFKGVQVFGDRIHASGSGDVQDLKRSAAECLSRAGIAVIAIEPIEASIEDVFVELLK
jgi:ABC-2 type transport system ATP-binding protein